jgi:hypothetical protein
MALRVAAAARRVRGIVGLYHRTDEWDRVKPTTVLLRPHEIASAAAMDSETFEAQAEPVRQQQRPPEE